MIKSNILSALLLLTFTITFFTACTDSKTEVINTEGVITNSAQGIADEPPLKFDLVKTIDLSAIEEPVLSSIGFLSVDDSGNFYFFDRNLMKMVSLDPEGNLRWAVGQEGKGPGDFENPFGMAIHKGKIYVANIQGSRIDEFDMEGNFIQSADMPSDVRFASLLGIREDGVFVLSGAKFGTVGTDVFTLSLGDSLKVESNFGIIESEDEKYQRATTRGAMTMRENDVVYAFNTGYQFQFYSYEGEKLTDVTREFEGTLGPGVYASGNSVSMYSLGRVSNPKFLDNGLYFISVRYPENIDDPDAYARRASTGTTEDPVYKEFLDVYNESHQLLYTYDDTEFVDGLGGMEARDSEGYFYSAFSNDLIIKKFNISPQSDE